MTRLEGVVVSISPDGRSGTILTAKDRAIRFTAADVRGDVSALAPGVPVSFQSTGGLRGLDVELLERSPIVAYVTHVSERATFARLEDSRESVFISPKVWPATNFEQGDKIRCVVTEGRDGRMFALALVIDDARRQLRGQGSHRENAGLPPEIAAVSRRGTRVTKSHNDDAFLVFPLLDDSVWVLALADGVSDPPNGWWAADQCLGLLWQKRASYAPRMARDGQQAALAWLEEIRGDFMRYRRRAASEYQGATSTFSLAVVRDDTVFCAHCGDSRVLCATQRELRDVFERKLPTQITQDLARPFLTSHIAAIETHWRPLGETFKLGRNETLMLCSDGVFGAERRAQKGSLLRDVTVARSLQEGAEAAAATIAEHGETDDLTLVCLRRREV